MIGEPRRHVVECESTQLLLSADDAHGTIVTADVQTAGRGRLGRTWHAPPASSVLVSALLRPPADRRAAELSLVAGVATALALEDVTGLAVQIKWPNDVMLARRKVAGILAEQRGDVVVLGIGVNVNQTRDELPAEAKVAPASLRTVTGREYDREAVLARLLGRLNTCYDGWAAGGLGALYEDLGARDFLRGRRVSVDGVPATAEMIERDGRLAVVTDAGEHRRVESGEVLFAR